MDTDVLIVGAGPTGLMLANQLARRGLRPVIIDRHSGPAQQTRAIGVQARTLEIYAQMGLSERALALGKIATGANLWAEGRRAARIPLGEMGKGISPFPFLLMLGQDDNEHILGDLMRESGVDIQWNTELVGLEQQADHVVATIRLPDGASRTLTAAWVGGCDGSKSRVREMCAIGFPGAPYEHVFFVADTVARGNMVPDELNVYLWKRGFHLFFPMRHEDGWRVIGILPDHLRGRDDLSFDDVVPSLHQDATTALAFTACHWFSTYRIHHRVATQLRAGRCFLLGDAAHVHSPVGAQGMNTGLQDAYNLGWKLAMVVKGEAAPTLLDTYALERMPVAERLVDTTDRAFALVVADNWIGRLFRTKILARIAALAMTRRRIRLLAFRTISQTGIHYRSSPLSETLGGFDTQAPQAGDRFPWMQLFVDQSGENVDPRSESVPVERRRATLPLASERNARDVFGMLDGNGFALILIGQPVADVDPKYRHLVRTLVVPAPPNAAELARVHVSKLSFWLLRPDGHIALTGTRYEAAVVDRYLSENYCGP